jgi:hypothetical protein
MKGRTRSRAIWLLVGVSALCAAGSASADSPIQLVCGEELKLSIDVEKRTVTQFTPTTTDTFVNGRVIQWLVNGRQVTVFSGGPGYLRQAVSVDNTHIRFSSRESTGSPFSGESYPCENAEIDRVSGILSYNDACGNVSPTVLGKQLRCAPGPATPFQKKF